MNRNEITDWEIITKNIFELVNKSEKSKTQISLEVGIKKSTLSQCLSGRAFPSLVTLKHLCNVLDCSYADILDEQK